MTFIDPTTIQVPVKGLISSSAWGDVVNTDLNVLDANFNTIAASLATTQAEIAAFSTFYAEMFRTSAYTQVATARTVFPFDTAAAGSSYLTLGAAAAYTVQAGAAGLYGIAAGVSFTPVTATNYRISLSKNGSLVRYLNAQSPDGTVVTFMDGATYLLCAVGDVLQIAFESTTASTVFFVGDVAAGCYASFARIGGGL